jgi:hypothetical protein
MDHTSKLPTIKSKGTSRGPISRREAVERLFAGAGVVLALPWVSLAHPIHKHLANASVVAQGETTAAAAEWTPELLDPHQNETLIVLAERIVPGSSKAQSNRFIDLLLSVDTLENREQFIAALGAFDVNAQRLFGRPFKELTADEQNQILTRASQGEPGRPKGEGDESASATREKEPGGPHHINLRDHFENMKGWVSGAFYSSEVGMRELGWTGDVYFEAFPGCQHVGGHQ